MDSGQLNENWNSVCMRVKSYDNVDSSQINAFFSRLQPQAMSEGFLMLTADNEFIKTWIERHYTETIKQALFDLYNIPFTVVIEVDTTLSANPAPQAAPAAQAAAMQPAATTSQAVSLPQTAETPQAAMTPQATSVLQAATTPQVVPTVMSSDMPSQSQPAAFQSASSEPASRVQMTHLDSSAIPAPQSALPASFQTAALRDAGSNMSATDSSQNRAASYTSTAQAPYVLYDQQPHEPQQQSWAASALKAESATAAAAATAATREKAAPSDERPTSTLTFENFVIGDSNRMAYSMAVGVAEMPGKTPLNPLFIYGKSGLGKTHLMRAIQNYICETQPYLRTVYVDSAELLSDYMEASAAHDKEKSSYKNFKTHYEEADVLLIDDIQYLQGKKQTLDIVFQIFNKLTNQGKQIVLSADRAPKNIDIDERYHSRFNQGGTIDIQPPEIETKLGIVKSFIKEYKDNEGLDQFSIPEDIQMYIAENSSSNIRELKSAVTKVIYQITFFNQPNLSVADVRVLLENHFSGGTSKNLTIEDIQKEVENFFKVKHSDLIGPKRARNIVYPRQIAIYLCRQMLDLPFNDIGKKFNRDHSTAMHSVATVEEMMRGSREVQEEIETLKQIIREL